MSYREFNEWIHKKDYISMPYLPTKAEDYFKPKMSSAQRLAMRKIPDFKVCKKCGKEKPAEAFNFASSNRDGLCGKCRECMNAERRALYHKVGWD